MSARVRDGGKSIGRRRSVNKTGNKSSGKVKAQELLSEHAAVVRPAASSALALPWLSPKKASKNVAIGLYLKTKGGCPTLDVSADIRFSSGELKRMPSESWAITDAWAIRGFFLSEDAPISRIRLRLTAPHRDVDLHAWGYAAGPFRDLAPTVELAIRKNDPEVDEKLLARIIALVRKQRFKYLESAYLSHAQNALTSQGDYAASRETVTCKHCSLCERLLPTVSFHGHSRFPSGYQLECRACKNCNINPKLNYKRTKQQLLESSLIRRELEYLAEENAFLRAHPDFIKDLFAKFQHRCFNCSKSVTRKTGHIDHTRPLVALWPLDRHASILCTSCNNAKHDSFPIDFYRDPAKRKALAAITGLSLAEVEARRMNMAVLRRITRDVPAWYQLLKKSAAAHIDTRKVKSIPDRSFRAVARRALEFEGIDLYKLYTKQTGRPFPGRR